MEVNSNAATPKALANFRGKKQFPSFEWADSKWKQCKKPGLEEKDKVAAI